MRSWPCAWWQSFRVCCIANMPEPTRTSTQQAETNLNQPTYSATWISRSKTHTNPMLICEWTSWPRRKLMSSHEKLSLEQFEDFSGPETDGLWRRYPIHHGKTANSDTRDTSDLNRTHSNCKFPNKYWNYNLGGVRVYTATEWQLTEPTTIHHHTWRHSILWTLCWLDRKAPILKIPQNSIWTSYVIDDTDQRTTTFPEKYEPRSTLICTMYADNNTTMQELHEHSRDHRVSA